MKAFLILVFSISFTVSVFGQELMTKQQADSLIKGNWKCDSNKDMIRFDCASDDKIYGYGLLGQKHKDWFIIFKYCDDCKGAKCTNTEKGTNFYLKEFYSNDPRMIPRELSCYRIDKISKTHLSLYLECGSNPCTLFTYTKVVETAPAKKKRRRVH